MTTEFPIPRTQYAESDGLSIAWQAFGAGAQDLIIVPGIVSHLDYAWEDPESAAWLRRLARTFRVIVFDKRGQGLSDRFDGAPTLEQRMDDVRAVMQAAGSPRPLMFAWSQGGAMGALFTATYPSMVERLVIFGAMPRFTQSADYPHRPTLEQILEWTGGTWGRPESVKLFTPSRAADAAYAERLARFQRQAASPGAIRQLLVADDQIDVRAILPQIRRPTLVAHRRGDRAVPRGNGRYFADHIPGATYLEVPGDDHFPWIGDVEAIAAAIEHFAGAAQPAGAPDSGERFVTTVLFTDIVASTEMASRLGDARWRERLQQFHAVARAQLGSHRGREMDTAGDGLFAIFDGPARAIRCAQAITREVTPLDLQVRAGIHTGEVEPSGDKVTGLAVHIGARVMALASASEVLVSSTTRDLVAGSGIRFEDHGSHALKGVPGEWRLQRAVTG